MTPEVEALYDRHVPSRLDAEPPLFKGMSLSEIQSVLLTAALVWLPISILVAVFIIHVWPVFLALYAISIALSLYFSGVFLQRKKRNKPDAYNEHKMKIVMYNYGIKKDLEYAYRPGKWSTSRTLRAPSKRTNQG